MQIELIIGFGFGVALVLIGAAFITAAWLLPEKVEELRDPLIRWPIFIIGMVLYLSGLALAWLIFLYVKG